METDMNTAEEPQPQQQEQQQAPASSTGLDPKLAALLAYLFTWLSGIIFLVIEKEDKYVRFHAAQSLVFAIGSGVAYFVLAIVFGIFTTILSTVSTSLGLIASLVGLLIPVVGLVIFIVWIMLLVKAYTGYDKGETYKLPVFGGIAEKIAG